jgi:hypothetical protein
MIKGRRKIDRTGRSGWHVEAKQSKAKQQHMQHMQHMHHLITLRCGTIGYRYG